MATTPSKQVRAGNVNLAVFENEVEGPKGKFTSFSVSIQKSYKTSDGKWKNSTSFKYNELPLVILACQEAMRDHYLRQNEIKVEVSDDPDF
jgi:hypothetical protein